MSQIDCNVKRLAALVWLSILALLVVIADPSTAFAKELKRFLGTVDSVVYVDSTRLIEVRGWAFDLADNASPAQFEVSVDGETVSPSMTAVYRPDVQTAHQINRSDIGFTVTGTLTRPLSGGFHRVDVVVIFSSGDRFVLHDWNDKTPQLHVSKARARHWILLALVCIAVALAYIPSCRRASSRLGSWVSLKRRSIGYAIGACFLFLVAFGITGSSLALLTEGQFGKAVIEITGGKGRVFHLRSIRADEWGVLTPNALAQVNHLPPFPVVNKNLGLEGQNMGVIGMTGVPIIQPAAVARPATWGYFALPLRQALSWQWQLPFFACLLALWAFLNFLRPQRAAINLALSSSFCVAPYAAAWSNWPLYATCFPVLSLLVLAAIFRAKKSTHAMLLGVALGFLGASWALVLYPPWQITVGTFCALLATGMWMDRREEFHFRPTQWASLGVALLIAGGILLSWWIDTSDAVAQMRSTVYPGSRNALQGGEIGHLWFFRGYMNAETLTFGTGPETNASEASSYFFLPLAVLWLGIWNFCAKPNNRWAIGACVAFIMFWFIFRFFGIPLWLAKITLWSSVPSGRLDLSLGLACTVLVSLVATSEKTQEDGLRVGPHWLISLALALASAALIFYGLNAMPKEILAKNSLPFIAAMLAGGVFMAWWLVRGRTSAAVAMALFLAIVSTVGFNPVSQAPRDIQLTARAAALVATSANDTRPARTLVIGGGISAMTFAAVGVPVVNGVLYYPQQSLWTQMKLPSNEWPKVNRYQHLAFNLANIPNGRPYRVANGLDNVNVEVDPRRFDFASTGAQRVAALEDEAKHLRDNPLLAEIGQYGRLVWFDVRRPQQ